MNYSKQIFLKLKKIASSMRTFKSKRICLFEEDLLKIKEDGSF